MTCCIKTKEATVFFDEDEKAHSVTKYNVENLTTLRVFCTWTGTIFKSTMLWCDTLFVLVLSISIAVLVHWFVSPVYVRDGILAHRDEFNKLTNYLGTLAVFLLGFYTSLSVSRWWRLRCSGIGNIWSATSQLTMYISTFVTTDPEVLNGIQRIGRGSMALCFMAQRGELGDLSVLHKEDILTEEEVACLGAWHSNMAESIWTWAAALVQRMHAQGLIKNDQILWFLMDRVNLGRSGAAVIGSQLGTQLPMQYVHLLGFLVKLYTLVVGITTGLLVSADINAGWQQSWLHVAQSFAKAIVVPFLYNAILVINCAIANPFGKDEMDFPRLKYIGGVKGDANSYINANQNRPSWLSKDAKPLPV